MTNLAAGGVQEGGSTLTQQLVKQTLLQTATHPRGAGRRDRADGRARKLREARLALALEDTYSKDEMLTRYLNIVYFGQNAYGVQPAARAFFGVDAAALDPAPGRAAGRARAEPADDDPFVDPEGATVRRNQVLTRMAAAGATSRRPSGTRRSPRRSASPRRPAPRRGCVEASVGPYVCDFVQRYLIQDLA